MKIWFHVIYKSLPCQINFMIVCLDCFKLYLEIDEFGKSLRLSGCAFHAMADL